MSDSPRFLNLSQTSDSDLRSLECRVKNKFRRDWLDEQDTNGDFLSQYIRKIDLPGLVQCMYCGKALDYNNKGKSLITRHAKSNAHKMKRDECLNSIQPQAPPADLRVRVRETEKEQSPTSVVNEVDFNSLSLSLPYGEKCKSGTYIEHSSGGNNVIESQHLWPNSNPVCTDNKVTKMLVDTPENLGVRLNANSNLNTEEDHENSPIYAQREGPSTPANFCVEESGNFKDIEMRAETNLTTSPGPGQHAELLQEESPEQNTYELEGNGAEWEKAGSLDSILLELALHIRDEYSPRNKTSELATDQAGSSSVNTTYPAPLDIAVFQQGSTPTPQVPADTRVNGSDNAKPTTDNIDSCSLDSDTIIDMALDMQDECSQRNKLSEHVTNQAGSSSDNTPSNDVNNNSTPPMDKDDARFSETDYNYPLLQSQINQNHHSHAHTLFHGAFDQNCQVPADTQPQRGTFPVNFYDKESGGVDKSRVTAECSGIDPMTSHVYCVPSSTASVLKHNEKRLNKLGDLRSRAKKKRLSKTVNKAIKEHAESLKKEKSLKQNPKQHIEDLEQFNECPKSILIEKAKPNADYSQTYLPLKRATNQAASYSDNTTCPAPLDVAVFQQGSTPTPQVPADTRVNGSGNGNENPWVVGHNDDDEDEEIFNFLKYHK